MLVTATLLWLLLRNVDLHRLSAIAAASAPYDFIAAMLLLAATTPANGLRWQAILYAAGYNSSLVTLMLIQLVGLFFNQFLPSGVGGDVVRAWRCIKIGIDPGTAIRSVILERAAGYLVMVAAFAAALPFLWHAMPGATLRSALLLVLAGSIAGFVSLFFFHQFPRRLTELRWLRSFVGISREARHLTTMPRAAVTIVGFSTLGLAVTVLGFQTAGAGVGISLSYWEWFAIVPVASIIQLLPVSLAGWGVREATFVVLLHAFDIPSERALTASIAIGVCQLVVSLPGSLIWLTGRNMGLSQKMSTPDEA